MTFDEKSKLASSLINDYWEEFKIGDTWNYLLWFPKYIEGDEWAKKQEWLKISKHCLEEEINVFQALEVLLYFEFDKYYAVAESYVQDYVKHGHDLEYCHDILAMFPNENSLRKQIFFDDGLESLLDDDGTGYSKSARQALIRAGDTDYCRFHGDYINKQIESYGEGEHFEEIIIPLVVELGKLSQDYVKKSNIVKVKNFLLNHLNKDKSVHENKQKGNFNDDDERTLWCIDHIASTSLKMGWLDILKDLQLSNWYWDSVFAEWFSDSNNLELLSWSTFCSNDTLKDRAVEVMKNHEYHKLDGAIAWTRLTKNISPNEQL